MPSPLNPPDVSFAAAMGPQPVDPFALPPPPKLSFGDVVLSAFGHGPDRMGQYNKNLDATSGFRLRSAQTEDALARAEEGRAKAIRATKVNELLTRAQSDPNYVPSVADLMTIADGAGDLELGRLRSQERGFRDTLASPTATPQQQFAAGQGVQGKVLPQIDALGAGRELNLLTQQPYTNPVGEAQIANYREQPVGSSMSFDNLTPEEVAARGYPVGTVIQRDSRGKETVTYKPPAGAAGTGGKPLTEFQVKLVSQLQRMDRTENMLNGPEFAGYVPSAADVAVDAVPLAGNYMVSEHYQKYKQAAREWISGLLRLDSGAAVPEPEFKTYFQTFFTQPGDDPTLAVQKAAAREAAVSALRTAAPQIATIVDASRAPRAPGAAPAAPMAAPTGAGKPMPPDNELADAAARRGVTVEALKAQLRAKGYQ